MPNAFLIVHCLEGERRIVIRMALNFSTQLKVFGWAGLGFCFLINASHKPQVEKALPSRFSCKKQIYFL